MAENDKDIENIEAWACVIERLLDVVPFERRAEALALAAKSHEAKRKELEANGGCGLISYRIPPEEELMARPGIRHSAAIARLMSLVVQVFTRDIKIDHRPDTAARILFARHPHGHGSGCLRDYLPPTGKRN
jgi:hypothetical protein